MKARSRLARIRSCPRVVGTTHEYADFNRLEIVLVIVNFEPVDITPLRPVPTP